MRDNFDGVAVFVEAVEAGGFARAAERLALSRSAVGKAIARLEERLGVRLFNRTPRAQSLTEDGQIYYERCVRALTELRAGEALLESGRREVSGMLKVSMPVLFGRYCVAPLLLELARQHPGLNLDLRFSDAVIDIIGDRFDLAIRNGAPGAAAGLSTRKVAMQHKVTCASPAYLAEHGAPGSLADLSDHKALVYWRGDRLFPWTFLDQTGQLVEARLNWRLQFDNQEAIVDAAVRGMGIAWVPSWLVHRHLVTGELVPVLRDREPVPLETYAVWPTMQHIPLRLRAAIDVLAQRLQAQINL